ncbi:MAG: hypothetical protein ACRD3E_20865 [Terriglobales bacterium]
MNYLIATEFESHGLAADTAQAWVTSASALIDAHCRRSTLGINEYTERLRVASRTSEVRVSYLPLAPLDPATSPIVKMRARYGVCRNLEDMFTEVAQAFALPGAWIDLDPAQVEWSAETGEITLATNALGFGFTEVEVTYTAGFADVPEPVKAACAQIVRNAQATPALNVRAGVLDRMQLEYFSDSLLDAGVRKLLAPYVAVRL